MNPHDLMTSHDAADAIGIKYATFRQRMTRGKLPIEPVLKLGGNWLWNRADVMAYKARLEAAH